MLKEDKLENTVSIPILTKRIFDCVSLKKKQSSFIEDVVFTIEDNNMDFDPKESICIEEISLTYRFIGLDANIESIVLVDSQPYLFKTLNEKIFRGCNSILYNENQALLVIGKFCCDDFDNNKVGIKTKITENDLNFLVCDLKIFAKGKIGAKEFTAIKDYGKIEGKFNDQCKLIMPPQIPISIEQLGFDAITFVGEICFPQGLNKTIINQKFNNCLSVKCITPKGKIFRDCLLSDEENDKFIASVELSLSSKKVIYSTIRKKVDTLVSRCP